MDQTTRPVQSDCIAAICFFCGTRVSEVGSAATLVMRKRISNGLAGDLPESSRWRRLKVEVPRCRQCRGLHFILRGLAAIGAIATMVAFGLTWWVLSRFLSPDTQWFSILGAAAVGPIIVILVTLVSKLLLRSKHIKGEQSSFRHEQVEDLLADGWIIGAVEVIPPFCTL